jgi:hypothetical protein
MYFVTNNYNECNIHTSCTIPVHYASNTMFPFKNYSYKFNQTMVICLNIHISDRPVIPKVIRVIVLCHVNNRIELPIINL